MKLARDDAERRRQVLLARVALQRFAWRADIGSLRASLRPFTRLPAWKRPAVMAALAFGAQLLRRPQGAVASATRLLLLAKLARRSWTIARRLLAKR